MSAPQVTVGIAGHGMLISPHCPCRVAHQENGVLLVAKLMPIDQSRAAFMAVALVKPGTAPATGEPMRVDERTWRLGDGGPEIHLPQNVPADLDAAFAQLDVGVGDAPWQLLAPGCWLGFPPGFTMSSTRDEHPFPELGFNHGGRSIPDAVIQFQARRVAARDVKLSGPFEVEESALEDIRVWTYGYDVEGVAWRKRHYALALSDDETVLMAAQAPAEHAARMFAGADAVALDFGPLR